MKYCKGLRVVNENNVYILNNKFNGQWMKLTEEVYSWISEAVESNMCQEDFLMHFNEESRLYMQEVINRLKKLEIIIEKEQIQEIQEKYWRNAEIAITSQCNLCCKHCCASDMEKKKQPLKSEIIMVIEKLASCGIEEITLTGGEPLIRSDFKEIVEYAKNKFAKLYLMTNATLITKEMATFIAKMFDGISISLDGYDRVSCEKIRGKNVFDRVESAIQWLHDSGFTNISISMVTNAYTYGHDDEFVTLNKKWHTKPVFRRFAPIGRGKENAGELFEILLQSKQPSLKSCCESGNQGLNSSVESGFATTICNALENSVYIGSDMHIYPCGALYMEEFRGENVLEITDLVSYYER